MSGSCQHNFDGNNAEYKRIIVIVITINAAMFFVEMLAGFASQSQALKADALDFFADSLTYAISLWAVNKSLDTRNKVARLKAASLVLMALWILSITIYRFFFTAQPEPITMSTIAVLAFLANLLTVILLLKYRQGDANVRSVWLCSRNDMINNVLVMIAAGLVFLTASPWPDLVIALVMALIFLASALEIIKHSHHHD